MGKRTEQVEREIYLISGNHDIKNLRQNYTKYFEQIAMQMYIEVDKQKIYLNHCPFLCMAAHMMTHGSYSDTFIPAGTIPERMLLG